jgi:hypothetical protein
MFLSSLFKYHHPPRKRKERTPEKHGTMLTTRLTSTKIHFKIALYNQSEKATRIIRLVSFQTYFMMLTDTCKHQAAVK